MMQDDQRAGAPPGDLCAPARTVLEERCALTAVAREQARMAGDSLHHAQRAYDILRERVDRAQDVADPRQVADTKERLHAAFRSTTLHSVGRDQTEAAARAWLDEINKLNTSVRDALRVVESGRADLRNQLQLLERLGGQADVARIRAESAEDGCRAAQQELAACEEEVAARALVADRALRDQEPLLEEPARLPDAWPVDQPNLPPPPHAVGPADRLGGQPCIVRILRGDHDARERVVAVLAAGDEGAATAWRLRLARLVDAITARAIEDGYLDLPADDPFWRLLEHRESREVVAALSSLGFRYDGLGGFADGRVPSPRDLSLAVGYAGLDRMRIRTWPADAAIGEIYAGATVAADEWLVDQADDLSLGRMVDALGGRAAEFADVWNAWGRVRPALLAP